MWRFVYFSREVADGEAAIREAWAEAIEMGETPEGSYMAAPFSALTTMTVGEQSEGDA